MKQLQTKILILVSSSILISALLVMGIAFSNYTRILESNSEQIMQLMCSEKRQAIDEKLVNIEQSVNTLYHFAMDQINETENLWQDEEAFEEHINRMRALIETTARYTDGALSVYYRLDSSIRGPKQGVWLVQNEAGEFVEQEVTDISQYEKDDVEHVGWYYIPIANGKETWMNPYYNQNMGEEIISFVIPVIVEDKVIGIVGMDISTSLLYDNVKTVQVYEKGYAFLMDNEGRFVYHPEMDGSAIKDEFDSQHAYLYEKSLLSAEKQSVEAYKWDNVDKRMISQKLGNGMIFTVCVTEEEIIAPQQNMLLDTIVVIILIMSLFLVATVYITKAIVKLMYTDTMTRLGNKTAYTEAVDALAKKIEDKGNCSFAVLVADINGLKKINDTYGHDYGDLLIQNGAAILKKVWGKQSIYRIGGDEFVILYPDANKETVEKEIAQLDAIIGDFNTQNNRRALHLQMAVGMANYDPEIDKKYMDVFRRADSAMYEDKKAKKEKKM